MKLKKDGGNKVSINLTQSANCSNGIQLLKRIVSIIHQNELHFRAYSEIIDRYF